MKTKEKQQSSTVIEFDRYGNYQLEEINDPEILEMIGGGSSANYLCPSGNVYCPSNPPPPGPPSPPKYSEDGDEE